MYSHIRTFVSTHPPENVTTEFEHGYILIAYSAFAISLNHLISPDYEQVDNIFTIHYSRIKELIWVQIKICILVKHYSCEVNV